MSARFQPEKSDGRSSDPRTLIHAPSSVCSQPNARKQDVAHTPESLEIAIRAAGALVEKFQNAGQSQKAREAFAEVRRLVALRTPETVEAMERARGLYRG